MMTMLTQNIYTHYSSVPIILHERRWTIGVVRDIKLTRKSLFLGLILAIVISNSFIYFAEIQTKAFLAWMINRPSLIHSNYPKQTVKYH